MTARGHGHAELTVLGPRRAVLPVDRDLLHLGLRRDAQDEGLLAAAAGGDGEVDALEAAARVASRDTSSIVSVWPSTPAGCARRTVIVRPARGGTRGEDAFGEARNGREAGGGAGPDRAAPQPPHLGPGSAVGGAQDDLGGRLERRLPSDLGLVAAKAHRHFASLHHEVGAGGGFAGEKRHAQGDRRAHGGHATDACLDGPRDAEAQRARDLEPRRVTALGGRGAVAGGEAAGEEDRRLGGAVGAQAADVPARRLGTGPPWRVGELQREAVARGRRPAASTRWTPRESRTWRKPEPSRATATAGAPSRRISAGVQLPTGPGSGHVPSAAAWTSALSWRRLSPIRRTRLGVGRSSARTARGG